MYVVSRSTLLVVLVGECVTVCVCASVSACVNVGLPHHSTIKHLLVFGSMPTAMCVRLCIVALSLSLGMVDEPAAVKLPVADSGQWYL